MHTTVDYGKLEGDAKREKAVQDVKNYLGERFHVVVGFVEASKELKDVEFGLDMFLGIEGYPVQAMWETYHK